MAKAVEVFRQNAISRMELEAARSAEQRRAALAEKHAALLEMAEAIESRPLRCWSRWAGEPRRWWRPPPA